MIWKISSTIIFALIFTAIIGCSPDRHATEGSASLPCAPSVYSIIANGADDFENNYPKARINVSKHSCRDAIDSLLNGKTEQIVLDRPLTHPESLAFQQKQKNPLIFRLARTPMSLIVNSTNSVQDLDSIQIAAILTGRFTTWNQVGVAKDRPIVMYMPGPGEGVWELIQVLFQTPSRIVAHVVEADSIAYFVGRDPDGFGAMAGVVPDWVKPLGIVFEGKTQHPTLRAVHEGRYPWVLPVAYITIKENIDVATSFLNYMSANAGQRLLANNGVLPAMVPLKIVDTKPK